MLGMYPLPSNVEFSSKKLILVIEGDIGVGSTLVQAIKEKTPYKAILATNGIEALNIIAHLKCDLFLLGYHFPYMNVFELYERLRATPGYQGTPALFLRAPAQPSRHETEGLRAREFIELIDLDHLAHTLQNLLSPAKPPVQTERQETYG